MRPAVAARARRGAARNARIRSASASGSRIGTTTRSSPKRPASSFPPGLSVETTGVPLASASRATEGAALGQEARPPRGALAGAPQREGIGHGWVDDRGSSQGHVQVAGPVEERLRVEGDVGGVAVEAAEAVIPAIVVPDLRAVVGQD